jgi:catechol 2,3-dioxygenase-like lactoylglutathione lyase family enzyme
MRGISENAVKYHARNIAGKLGVAGTSALRQWPGQPVDSALRRGKESGMAGGLELGPLGQVSLRITDVARAEAFYGESLGLRHVFTFGDLAFFWAGDVRIYLQKVPEDKWKSSSVLYVLFDAIVSTHQELLRRGVKFVGAPHLIYRDDATGSEEWMAFFHDTEGNMLAVMARVPGVVPKPQAAELAS